MLLLQTYHPLQQIMIIYSSSSASIISIAAISKLTKYLYQQLPCHLFTFHSHYYYNYFTASWTLSGTTQLSRYQKGKTNLDLLEQEIVSDNGISWAICKSVPHPTQVTMPASHQFKALKAQALEAVIIT